MKYSYSQEFSPPAPVLSIEAFVPDGPERRRLLDAKLDTAADISAIPSTLVDELDLEAVSEVLVSGYDGQVELVRTYVVGLELPEARVRRIEAILMPEPYVLLGRDVLNHFYIYLQGPDLAFEMDVHHEVQ
jgi:hypothetical protein